MSELEELLYRAEEHGKRYQMFKEIEKVRNDNPKLTLMQQYEKAFKIVMNI
jgi:hypothetical protein